MASGILVILDEVLQTLPPGSAEATKLKLAILALQDALLPPDMKKLLQELASERDKRERAESELAACMADLGRFRQSD